LTVLRKHSIVKDPERSEEMLKEWKHLRHYADEGENCLCGVKITYCHLVVHVNGTIEGPIGSTCIDRFGEEFGEQAKAIEKDCKAAREKAKRARDKAIRAAREAVAIARTAATNAPANEARRKTNEARWKATWAINADAVVSKVLSSVLQHEDIGQRLVPDNFNLHQGKTLAVLWQKHRSYCNFVMEKNRVYDPDVRQWFRAQGCSW
tara:strand:+ start:2564 stop:3184 length:621 start_codon:yes stop_codon:yes gene_type:complete